MTIVRKTVRLSVTLKSLSSANASSMVNVWKVNACGRQSRFTAAAAATTLTDEETRRGEEQGRSRRGRHQLLVREH
jgi:hypothetical protein